MKKLGLVLIALIALLGLVGCPGTTDSNDPSEEIDYLGTWGIKGSFDAWKQHRFIKDPEQSNIGYWLTPVLYDIGEYEFVLLTDATTENDACLKLDETTAASYDLTEWTTFSDANGDNAKFTPAKNLYKVEIDVSTATAPKVKVSIVDDATDLTSPNFEIASKALSIHCWGGAMETTNTEYNESESTVAFTVKVTGLACTFGVKNNVGAFLKADGDIVSTDYVDMGYDEGSGCLINTEKEKANGAEYVVTVKLPILDGVVDTTSPYQIKAAYVEGTGTALTYKIEDAASYIKIKGSMFTESGATWTDLSGTYDATNKNVTFVVTGAGSGEFGVTITGDYFSFAADAMPVIDGPAVNLKAKDNTNGATVLANGTKYDIIVTPAADATDATLLDIAGAHTFQIKTHVGE